MSLTGEACPDCGVNLREGEEHACLNKCGLPEAPGFSGTIWQDGDQWLAECPTLDLMTQGTSRADAGAMLKDAVEALVNKPGFAVEIVWTADDRVMILSDDHEALEALRLARTQ